MTIRDTLVAMTPETIKKIIRPWIPKSDSELAFWRSRYKADNGRFRNDHYERLMLAMAQESSAGFLRGRIVADFGCGPRGSLAWAEPAAVRIGIDVLADRYAEEFTDSIKSHGMVYVKSTEKVIPLPSDFVDVMFTLNAIDHVDDFAAMCAEIVRVMKPGGRFIGSFNLEEPASSSEPQQLNEAAIRSNLLDRLVVDSYRITVKGPDDDLYRPFFSGQPLTYTPGEEGFLWVSARKPERS
jgi:SAM-dependent methyltransferase